MKRAVITDSIFRVSVPGVDVDTAEDHEFLIHEGHLIAQAYFNEYLPFPPNIPDTGSAQFTVPEIKSNTAIVYYGRMADDIGYYPEAPNIDGVNARAAKIYMNIVNSTTLEFHVTFPSGQRPKGVFVLFLRSDYA